MLLRLLICCLLPLWAGAQSIAGLWKGTLTTHNEVLQFELLITGSGDKLNGYAMTTFRFLEKDNTGIKTITLKKRKQDWFLEDGELIYDNYTTAPKKVLLTAMLMLQNEDGPTATLRGPFSTRSMDMRARNQNNLQGMVVLQKQNDADSSKLLAQMEKIQPDNDLAAQLGRSSATQNLPQQINSESGRIYILPAPAIQKIKGLPFTVRSFPVNKLQPNQLPGVRVQRLVFASRETAAPVASTPKKAQENINQGVTSPPVVSAHLPQQQLPPPNTYETATIDFENRNIEIIRSVEFTADSLVLRLYDNGEIDGDTVSVLLNGRLILSRQALSATAITHVIYLHPDLGDTLQLVMFAENLGSLPPNTGLLTIQDGNQRHQINFSGDFQNNSAILLRRKR